MVETARDPDGRVRDQRAVRRRRVTSARLRGDGTVARRAWQSDYIRRILAGDVLCAVAAAVVGYLVRFGATTDQLHSPTPPVWLAAILPFLWVLVMLIGRTYERRFLWVGPEEYRRVFSSAVMLLAGVGTVSWAWKLEIARGFVVVALPLATLLTLLQRYYQRLWLHRQHWRGRFVQTALIVGHRNGVEALHAQLQREAHHGYRAIGCCLPTGPRDDQPPDFGGPPVLGGLSDVIDVVRRFEVDTVAVLPCPELDGSALRRLGWELEKTQAELMLAPAVTEIAGPRVRIRPVCGLPLLHMERPELHGVRRLTKEVVDRTLAACALLFLAPVLLSIAAAIASTTRGPVFFMQQRVGRDGSLFPMLKFRTMVQDAERMRTDLAVVDDGNGVLFKLHKDPRVTRVGRLLRRYSLDEIPQLINVIRGEMSLVGPRPPLSSEVERYGFDMRRRFLVKPGITGLWQISGRSDLSWDDSVRIDLRYVENWSLAMDLMILWKTVGAVRRGAGAY